MDQILRLDGSPHLSTDLRSRFAGSTEPLEFIMRLYDFVIRFSQPSLSGAGRTPTRPGLPHLLSKKIWGRERSGVGDLFLTKTVEGPREKVGLLTEFL